MEERQPKAAIITLSTLLALSIIIFAYFYFVKFNTVERNKDLLQSQVTQLQNDISKLTTKKPETADEQQPVAVFPGKVQTIQEIYFSSGFSLLDARAKAALRETAEQLKNYPDAKIQIIGHSDSVPIGRNLQMVYPTNWELSVQRALSAAKYLQNKSGTAPEKYIIVGLSHSKPQAPNKSETGRSKNRRVQVQIIKK